MHMLPTNPLLHLMLLVNRVALGLYFMFAGLGKVQGEISGGLGSFYRGKGFQGLQPDWLPRYFAQPFGYAMPWVELVLGALLVVGLLGRVSAGLIALLLLSFLIAMFLAESLFKFQSAAADLPGPFHTNLILLALALLLTVTGSGRYSLDGAWRLGRERGRAEK